MTRRQRYWLFHQNRFNWEWYAQCELSCVRRQAPDKTFMGWARFIEQKMQLIAGEKFQDWGYWLDGDVHSTTHVIMAFPSSEVRNVFLLSTEGFTICSPKHI